MYLIDFSSLNLISYDVVNMDQFLYNTHTPNDFWDSIKANRRTNKLYDNYT